MQKFKLVGLVGLVAISVSLGLFGGLYIANNKSNETYEDTPVLENKELLSMMLETEAGSGKYQETMASSWPTDGYIFNETLSKCENGGTLSWDSTNKKVVLKGAISDKCYAYFDVGIFFADYIKSLYTTQGANNLYLHDSTLANGANDGSYRYAGSSETTNNFVCFGYDSTDGTCPTDYLYRIIGVFGNNVKLIKNESIIDLKWDDNFSNTWATSTLNAYLNETYINSLGSYSSNIEKFSWVVGGNTWTSIGTAVPKNVYQNEIINPDITNSSNNEISYKAKIGLMYVSDYLFAASPDKWSLMAFSESGAMYDFRSATSVNWMFKGTHEWTITRTSNYSYSAFYIDSAGHSIDHNVDLLYNARPVFYLSSMLKYKKGEGTVLKPFTIS